MIDFLKLCAELAKYFILSHCFADSTSEDHHHQTKEEKEDASHWKEMMLNAIGEREQTEQEKLVCGSMNMFYTFLLKPISSPSSSWTLSR